MRRIRVYADTSVFGGARDVEFAEPSRRVIERARAGEFVLLVSDVTYYELQMAPDWVRRLLEDLPNDDLVEVPVDDEVTALAQAYIDAGILGYSHVADATHVAAATVARADLILSWNFKHIVNYNRIHKYNSVNVANGYPSIEIHSPLEMGNDDKD